MIEFFIALTLPDSGNVSGFALRRLAFLSVVREIVDLTLTFLSSLVKNDRVSLQKSIQLISLSSKLSITLRACLHSKYTCRCEEFLQSMSPIRDSRTVSGGSMSGHRFIVTLFAGTTRKKDPCRFGFFYGRNRIDIREQDEFQSVWTFTHLIHGTNRFVSFSDVIVASSRSRVINIPDNGPLSLDRENEPRRQARKKPVFWGTWSGGWGGPPIIIIQSWNFLEKCFIQVFFWNLAL